MHSYCSDRTEKSGWDKFLDILAILIIVIGVVFLLYVLITLSYTFIPVRIFCGMVSGAVLMFWSLDRVSH